MDAKLSCWIENTLIPLMKGIRRGFPHNKTAIILNAIDKANPSLSFIAYTQLSGIPPGERDVVDGLEGLVCYTDKAIKEFIKTNGIEDLTFEDSEMWDVLVKQVKANE